MVIWGWNVTRFACVWVIMMNVVNRFESLSFQSPFLVFSSFFLFRFPFRFNSARIHFENDTLVGKLLKKDKHNETALLPNKRCDAIRYFHVMWFTWHKTKAPKKKTIQKKTNDCVSARQCDALRFQMNFLAIVVAIFGLEQLISTVVAYVISRRHLVSALALALSILFFAPFPPLSLVRNLLFCADTDADAVSK